MNGSCDDMRTLFRGQLLYGEPLSRHTSLKVGGPADIFAVPENVDDLRNLLRLLKADGAPWLIIGGGYNLLVRDGGFRGAVITLKKLDRIEYHNGLLYAESGVSNQALASFARDNGLAGLEFLVGIPGSLGGALCMNAGAHGGETFDRVSSVDMLNCGIREKCEKMSLNYGYRRLQLGDNKIIISAEFSCRQDGREAIAARMDDCLRRRRESQKVALPNAGSFFKNPAGQMAWRLIDEAGLRGCSVGGAQVSEVHTNFLVNRGGATAADFLELAALVKKRVLEKSGLLLEEEVRIVGDDRC